MEKINVKNNTLDKQYTDLLQDILDNGVTKQDRTGTGTISVFGRQIRHSMKDGFPLLTTKKMYFKGIVAELLWFLRGSSDIRDLWRMDCHIWDGDFYKRYCKQTSSPYSLQELIEKGLNDSDPYLDNSIFDLGKIYGAQWRSWKYTDRFTNGEQIAYVNGKVDQIAELIKQLKENPDSRRLLVTAWNPADLPNQVLPPCHYGFQVYTRELSLEERRELVTQAMFNQIYNGGGPESLSHKEINQWNVPTRAISLMWNQRSVDTFLGLPFNIASYGLLLEIIAKAVNMVPDQLIGNLGDVHLYSNHIEQAKEQIGRKYTHEERKELLKQAMGEENYNKAVDELMPFGGGLSEYYDSHKIPYKTREPYPLPKLNINTEFWPYEGGECGEGPLDAVAVFESFKDDYFCKCLLAEDIQLGNYQSHPTIKAPLSN